MPHDQHYSRKYCMELGWVAGCAYISNSTGYSSVASYTQQQQSFQLDAN